MPCSDSTPLSQFAFRHTIFVDAGFTSPFFAETLMKAAIVCVVVYLTRVLCGKE